MKHSLNKLVLSLSILSVLSLFTSCSKAPTTIAYLQYCFEPTFFEKYPDESYRQIESIMSTLSQQEYFAYEYSCKGEIKSSRFGNVSGDLSSSLKSGKLGSSQFDITDFGYVDNDYFKILKINTALQDTTVLTEWKMSELDVSKRSIFNSSYWISYGPIKRMYYDIKRFDDSEIYYAFVLTPEDFGCKQ